VYLEFARLDTSISLGIVTHAKFIFMQKGQVFAAPFINPSTIYHPPSSSRLVFLD